MPASLWEKLARRLLISDDMPFPKAVQRSMAILSAALVMAQPALCSAGAQRSVAVQAIADDDSDDASREIAREISDALRASTSHHIVDSDLAAGVAAYQEPSAASLPDAAVLISAAKDHYFNFRYDDANQSLERAITLLKADGGAADANALLLDAYVSKALIANSRGKKTPAREALDRAMQINPMLRMTADDYPPSMISLYEEVRASRAGLPAGSLFVRSIPEGAEVFLNGISQGISPLALEGLPAGNYSLALRANRYARVERSVAIAAGIRTQVKQRLKWAKEGNDPDDGAAHGEASAAVRDGIRIADALKIERAVLIDADAAGEGSWDVTARTIDRTLRAGSRPLRIEGLGADERSAALAKLVKGISGQIDLDMARDPAASIYPQGEADAIVLAKRKKPLARRPLFWGAVGVAAAGAIVGGILAAMSGGAKTGEIKVTFK